MSEKRRNAKLLKSERLQVSSLWLRTTHSPDAVWMEGEVLNQKWALWIEFKCVQIVLRSMNDICGWHPICKEKGAVPELLKRVSIGQTPSVFFILFYFFVIILHYEPPLSSQDRMLSIKVNQVIIWIISYEGSCWWSSTGRHSRTVE